MRQLSRRGFFGVAGATGLLAATACSAGKSTDNAPDGGPVTISHLFGETTVPAPPTRVVSAGYTGQDYLLAVGVVPVAVTDWFGDQPFGVWPWAQPELGAATPVVLNLDNGIQVDRLAGLEPDLIVATNAGVDADTYQKLTQIAPTIPQSGGDAFFEPWRDQAAAIGQAVFAAEQMTSLVDDVDRRFTAAAEAHPNLNDKRALLLHGRLQHDTAVAVTGWSTGFLTQLGLVVGEGIDSFAADQRAVIPREQLTRVLGAADVLIWTTEGEDDKAALLADPDIATVQNRSVFTSGEQAGAIAFASPLSYPLVADQLPPLLAKIVG
jgi:iron complex transport system substrate-binding protein